MNQRTDSLVLRFDRCAPRQQVRRTRRHLFWVPLTALVATALSHSIAAAPTKEVRQLLILNEIGTSHSAIHIVRQRIEPALNGSPDHLESSCEYINTALFLPDRIFPRVRTVWGLYKWYIVGSVCFVIVEILMILSLVGQRAARYKSEKMVRESEERFELVANGAPVLIWMSGTDMLCNYFNEPWLEFTGRPLEVELGSGWAEGVHSDDIEGCLRTYTESFERRDSFEMQYRLRRKDGQYRWILDKGVPRFNQDGTFAGYIGSCIDITDRKHTEEAISAMGSRLIEAHEEERTWIARELHDDINQRLALLIVELDRWHEQRPNFPVEFHDRIRKIQQHLSDLARDIQALSHRLHSSKLEYLGLAVASKSFCKEFSDQRNVEIDFCHTAIPQSLPMEISLSLFRVLQESLQNAVKHSQVRYFRVELCGTAEGIQLTVRDLGVGFHPPSAFARGGLGLTSMRERMQLVNGQIFVESRPGGGTTIRARVPFSSSSDSVSVAG